VKIAGISERIIGGIIDLIVSGVLLMFFLNFFQTGAQVDLEVAKSFAGSGHYTGTATEYWASNQQTIITVIAGIVAIYILFAVMEYVFMKTPGKMLVGTRVVNKKGNRINPIQALVRNLFRIIDGIPVIYLVGLFFVIVTPDNQRLGDIFANTVVVVKDE